MKKSRDILVNTQPEIKALTSFRIATKSVLVSRAVVKSVARNKRLNFYGEPGQKDIEAT